MWDAIADIAAKSVVLQIGITFCVVFYFARYVVPRGEKDMPTEDEMRTILKREQALLDISENVKIIVTIQTKMHDVLNRFVSEAWNRGDNPRSR